jgi:hypothetical protein
MDQRADDFERIASAFVTEEVVWRDASWVKLVEALAVDPPARDSLELLVAPPIRSLSLGSAVSG